MRGCPTDSEYRLTGWDAKLAAIAEAPFSPGNPLPQPCAARRLRETAASRMLKIRSEISIYTVFSCNQANESRKMAARKELQIMSDHHHPSGPSNYIGLLRRICPKRTLLTYMGVKQSHEMRNAMEWDLL